LPSYRLPSAHDRHPLQRRASGLALAVGLNAALVLALLGIGAFTPTPPMPARAVIVDLVPESHSLDAPPAKAIDKVRPSAKPAPQPPRALPEKAPIPNSRPLDMIEMSSAELAAADIGKLPRAGDGGGSPGDSKEVGRGPHGEVLYAAEWARKPTEAELGGYLPPNAPDGSGLIACRTIPDNRVDNCVELGNDPPGSHLASAVRQAAWQFRVRPPRRGGRPMIGEWVRIRIDYYRISGG
jgi:protein TonB